MDQGQIDKIPQVEYRHEGGQNKKSDLKLRVSECSEMWIENVTRVSENHRSEASVHQS